MRCNSYLLAVSAGLLISVSAFSQTPPPQPANGPGGADYPHARVEQLGPYYPSGLSGDDKYRYLVYQPAEPRPKEAPVVLLLHGRSAVSPDYYLFWIRHLVRKGYLVIWTQFEYFMAPSGDLVSNALVSYSDALNRIQNDTTGAYVQPLRDQNGYLQTAILGHSFGGYLAVVMAARSTESGSSVPVPKLLFGVNTGNLTLQGSANFSRIPPSTNLVFMVANDDSAACKASTQALWALTPQIQNRTFLVVNSDSSPEAAVIAHHYYPTIAEPPDTLDYNGLWKISVAALNCTFYGQDCEYAFGKGGREQVSMGEWSDGRPFTPLTWAPSPAAVSMACERDRRR